MEKYPNMFAIDKIEYSHYKFIHIDVRGNKTPSNNNNKGFELILLLPISLNTISENPVRFGSQIELL